MILRRALTMPDMQAVWRLTYTEHLRRGQCRSNPQRELRHHPEFDERPEGTNVWMLEEDTTLIGTISITIDGRIGLPLDVEFPEAVQAVRAAAQETGAKLAAVWRMVSLTAARQRWRVCQRLIAAAIDDMIERRVDVMLITVHPRHASYYERTSRFERVAESDCDPVVGGAPAVLMLGRLSEMIAKWR